VKTSQEMSWSTSTPLMALAPCVRGLLDRCSELVFGGVLEHHPDVSQSLAFAHCEHAALDGRERIGEQADERVRSYE
jgi:hypothetical protein